MSKIPPAASESEILSSISSVLSQSFDINDTIGRIFEILDAMGLHRGTLSLKDPISQAISIRRAFGLTPDQVKRGKYEIGEGVIGQVIKSGEIAVISNTQTHPKFLNRTGARDAMQATSFICVPIRVGTEVIGTLSADRDHPATQDDLSQDVRLLTFISIMISQELSLKQLMESEKAALATENLRLKDELKNRYNIHNMIGNSTGMHSVYESIHQVANSNATVLIRGESGTGKELIAQAIHYNSNRSNHPFIKINCGAIPESLIESELFGFERGAFTDAKEMKLGKFEIANNGTLFLDEIGELSPALQVKFLRVLQEREIERIGGIHPIKINVRIVCATNRNLEHEMAEKRFREDLYYRLNVFPIFSPPLRDRKSDILLLSEHFLDKYSKENNKQIDRISSFAIDLLTSYHWPGNVRELENCMERAVLICNGDTLQSTHLPPTLQRIDSVPNPPANTDVSFTNLVQNFERELIIDSLKKNRGNKSKSARSLGLTDRIISYKINQLNISLAQFKTK